MKFVTLQDVLHGLRQRIACCQIHLPWVKLWRRCTRYLRTLCTQHVSLHCVWRAVPVLLSSNVPLLQHATILWSSGYLNTTKSQWNHCLYFLLGPEHLKTKIHIGLCNTLYKVLTSQPVSLQSFRPVVVRSVRSHNTQSDLCPPVFRCGCLTFWRRNCFLILAHIVYKMWIIQEPNKLELWNKLHFEEKKTESIYHV